MASGAGDERLLLKSTNGDKYATSSSRDGRFLLYTVENPETKSDLWVLPLQDDRKPTPFLRTEFNESSGQFSPDGHWIAYASDQFGSDEIYLREFSSGSAQGSWDAASKRLISRGAEPNPDGAGWQGAVLCGFRREAHVSRDQRLPVFQAGAPTPLFESPLGFIGRRGHCRRQTLSIGVPVAQSASVPFTVVLNWQTTLKK
jgi:dipeptidyl aminopeptidase/acylaminoacyl peptidase